MQWWPSLLTSSAWSLQDIVTESNQFDLVSFIPLLRERIYSNNQYARQFIISWVGAHCQSVLQNAVIHQHPVSGQTANIHRDVSAQAPEFTWDGGFKPAEFFTCFFKIPSPCDHSAAVVGMSCWCRMLHTKLENEVKASLV